VPQLSLSALEDRVTWSVLRRQAEAAPDRIFLMDEAVRFTYEETVERAERFAAGLASLGVAPGSGLIVYMHKCADFVVAALAANRVGAFFTPISTEFTGDWLAEALRATELDIVLTDAELLPEILRVREAAGIKTVIVRAADGSDGDTVVFDELLSTSAARLTGT
jgi:carnitine-CoA ligase